MQVTIHHPRRPDRRARETRGPAAPYHLPVAHRETLGTDAEYLRGHQYKDPGNLNARIALHAKYARSDEPWFPWLASRVEWGAGMRVLEVGCGSGVFWVNVAALLPAVRLTLTDLSTGMLEAATAAVAPLPNIEVVGASTCDAQHLPFADDEFDLVVANHMLYHVPDPARAGAEFARVLTGTERSWRRPTGRTTCPRCVSSPVPASAGRHSMAPYAGSGPPTARLSSERPSRPWPGAHTPPAWCAPTPGRVRLIVSSAAGFETSAEQRDELRTDHRGALCRRRRFAHGEHGGRLLRRWEPVTRPQDGRSHKPRRPAPIRPSPGRRTHDGRRGERARRDHPGAAPEGVWAARLRLDERLRPRQLLRLAAQAPDSYALLLVLLLLDYVALNVEWTGRVALIVRAGLYAVTVLLAFHTSRVPLRLQRVVGAAVAITFLVAVGATIGGATQADGVEILLTTFLVLASPFAIGWRILHHRASPARPLPGRSAST